MDKNGQNGQNEQNRQTRKMMKMEKIDQTDNMAYSYKMDEMSTMEKKTDTLDKTVKLKSVIGLLFKVLQLQLIYIAVFFNVIIIFYCRRLCIRRF